MVVSQQVAHAIRLVGQFLRLAQDLDGLVGDLFAERREADYAARPFDERHAKQRLELAQTGGQGRLGDETGVGGSSEMPEAPQRDEVLELFYGRQVNDH